MKRQTLKSGMIGKDTLGSFIVKDESGRTYDVGPGILTHRQRDEIWFNREEWLGKTITHKHKLCGEKLLPRSPTFVGRRDSGE